MAYQEITGGDGETGQTGEEVKDIINESFEELYIRTDNEISRAWTETLLFDKKEITFATHVMSGNLTYELALSGHLVDIICGGMQTITVPVDNTYTINFGAGFNFIYGVNSGDILEEGTYQIFFLYINGSVTVNMPGVSSQSSGLQRLATPGSFTATPDGENAIDLAWTDVSDEVEYQIEKSTTGTGGWVLLTNPAAGATSYTDSGLNAGDQFYYRIKAVGNGVSFNDSLYATAFAQTDNSGDTTPPSFTFYPTNGSSTHSVNEPIVITSNEPIRSDSGTAITNANVATFITLKQTNSGGANIAFTATIDITKTVITITPTTHYGANQLVYVAVDNVEDTDGNELVSPSSITFTTTAYTILNGLSNYLNFGNILNSLFATNDTNFWIEQTIKDSIVSGVRVLWCKNDPTANHRTFVLFQDGSDIRFNYSSRSNQADPASLTARSIRWTGAATADEVTWVLKYNGALDTNDGLDRAVLEKDGVVQGSKTLDSFTSALPGSLYNSLAPLGWGVDVAISGAAVSSQFFNGEAKDLIVRSSNGATVEINVPNIRAGTDISGNGRNGTWV